MRIGGFFSSFLTRLIPVLLELQYNRVGSRRTQNRIHVSFLGFPRPKLMIRNQKSAAFVVARLLAATVVAPPPILNSIGEFEGTQALDGQRAI